MITELIYMLCMMVDYRYRCIGYSGIRCKNPEANLAVIKPRKPICDRTNNCNSMK